MTLLASVEAPEQIGGRLTTTKYANVDRLYLPGRNNVYRYNWDGKSITLDREWGPVKYIKDGQTTAPAAAVMSFAALDHGHGSAKEEDRGGGGRRRRDVDGCAGGSDA